MIHIIDFAWHGSQTLFVECAGKLDDIEFKGMVRVVDGIIYGDLVKESKSELTAEAIRELKKYIQMKYEAGQFN